MVTMYSRDGLSLVVHCYSGTSLVSSCRFCLDSNKMPVSITSYNISLTPAVFRYWLRTILAFDFTALYSKCSRSESVEDSDDLFR